MTYETNFTIRLPLKSKPGEWRIIMSSPDAKAWSQAIAGHTKPAISPSYSGAMATVLEFEGKLMEWKEAQS